MWTCPPSAADTDALKVSDTCGNGQPLEVRRGGVQAGNLRRSAGRSGGLGCGLLLLLLLRVWRAVAATVSVSRPPGEAVDEGEEGGVDEIQHLQQQRME